MSGISALNSLNRAHNTTMSSMQKIATGSQHPSASYGPSDYAISQRMNSNIGAVQQSNQNTQTSNAMLNVASGAIKNTVDALSSLKENILNAMNGTNTDSDRGALQKTVDQTVAQINDNASVTFNGKSLLDGGRTATVAGVIGNTQISFGDMTAQGLGLVDENGSSNLDLSTDEGMQNALATVDNALSIANEGQQQVSSAQNGNMDFESALDEATTIGAQQQRLEYQAANYTTMQENMAAADATMDGTDMAAEITKLRSAQTQEQLAMYGVQMYNQNRANILNLLP